MGEAFVVFYALLSAALLVGVLYGVHRVGYEFGVKAGYRAAEDRLLPLAQKHNIATALKRARDARYRAKRRGQA